MPRISLDWKPLQTTHYRAAAKKMKLTAATGPDGFAREDVLYMPEEHLQTFANMMSCIEAGQQEWPEQLLMGLTICSAKHEASAQPRDYRPINLFSVLYRLWSSIRTRQLLVGLKEWLPECIVGFVPGCEAPQIWEYLQCCIEQKLNEDEQITGASLDLEKAFNFIGREQTFYIAEHIKLPLQLLNPWKQFVERMSRRFEIRGCVSEATTSTSGYLEGCPLSIVAMLLSNWAHAQYMAVHAPSCDTFIYVDNISITSTDASNLLQGYMATKVFYKLWGLEVDEGKTFGWATSTQLRKELQSSGFRVVKEARELGGIMNYTKVNRNARLKLRFSDLDEKWQRLARSMAAAALHGSPNCFLADSFIVEMRRKALRMLRLNAAGTNPALRLTLSDNALADPGFFQLQMTIANFIRMLRKSDAFLEIWQMMARGNQTTSPAPGPCEKFRRQIESIGWHLIDSLKVIDHRGSQHHLIYMDAILFKDRLHEAWIQKVCSQVKHKTMHDLNGLEFELTMLDCKKLTPIERMRLSAFHSGTFITNSQKIKFDSSKVPTCATCGLIDDRKHWLSCPLKRNHRHDFPIDWEAQIRYLPDCTAYHMLVPWQHELHVLDDYFDSLQPFGEEFECMSSPKTTQQLFLDGSCFGGANKLLSYASWAVVHGDLNCVVSCGHVVGRRQTIDRAELSALVMATKWTAQQKCQSVLWSDSASTVHIARKIIATGSLEEVQTNLDLWHEFLLLIRQLPKDSISVNWVPSHMDLEKADDCFEEWLITGNALADEVAVRINLQRPTDFWQKLRSIDEHWNRWKSMVGYLRRFFFSVAKETGDRKHTERPRHNASTIFEEDDEGIEASLTDFLPVDWIEWIPQHHPKCPAFFFKNVIDQLAAWDTPDSQMQLLTDIELCVGLARINDFCFPFWDQNKSSWVPRTYSSHFERPLISRLLSLLAVCLDEIVRVFGLDDYRLKSIKCVPLGIEKIGNGLLVKMSQTCRRELNLYMCRFTARRPFRTAADLSRPLALV